MLVLSMAILFLIASHVVLSQTTVREALIAAAGPQGFRIGYSLVSTLALLAVIAAYRNADGGPWLWTPGMEDRYIALVLMPLAFFLLVCRFTQKPEIGQGIYRITTTPGSLAVLIWSLVHLMNVGEARTILVFVGMLVIALASLVRNAGKVGHGLVGAIPFARILSGRDRLALREIGLWRPLLALVLTKLVLLLHPLVIGVDPLTGF